MEGFFYEFIKPIYYILLLSHITILKIANRRIFPAIDLTSSSTRRDDLLLGENVIQRMWVLRKYLADMNPVEAMEFINDRIKNTRNNEEFLISMNS
jgi:transcription termination factor Rho